MLFLKSLKLSNYCGYDNQTFNFCKKDGTPYRYICFFGPNGIGKSTLLEAISMLTANWTGRGASYIQQSLQKYVRNIDYDPTWQKVLDKKETAGEMVIEGTYCLDGKDYVVTLTQDGYTRNDFAPIPSKNAEEEEALKIKESGPWGKDHLRHRQRVAHFLKTDSDLSMHKFQLHRTQKEQFEKIVSMIMRYSASCSDPVGFTSSELAYCTDVIIQKQSHKIHFKRMSAGEKKICKSFSDILNTMRALEHPSHGESPMIGWPRLLLIDNIVMHVYYDRHVQMVECLKEVFEHQQIFSTTHSGVLIQRHINGENNSDEELMFDLEKIKS